MFIFDIIYMLYLILTYVFIAFTVHSHSNCTNSNTYTQRCAWARSS